MRAKSDSLGLFTKPRTVSSVAGAVVASLSGNRARASVGGVSTILARLVVRSVNTLVELGYPMFLRFLPSCFLICILTVSTARAAVVLQVDLRTVDQVTFSAPTGLSSASISGSDNDFGVYLKDFLGGRFFTTSSSQRVFGADLVYFNSTSGGSPTLYRGSSDPGLNMYGLDNGTPNPASFTAGVQAFKGSATWLLTSSAYAVFLQAPTSGDVYAFAYQVDHLDGGPQVIGQYSVVTQSAVPEPTSMAIFGFGALVVAYRARRKRVAVHR
ncbi:MAG: PEP-CTERM sorting domain-containing protein [Planctomycetota bacterium]